jgi:hypothetical protein
MESINKYRWYKTSHGLRFVVTGIVYGGAGSLPKWYEVLFLESVSPVTIPREEFLSKVDRGIFKLM